MIPDELCCVIINTAAAANFNIAESGLPLRLLLPSISALAAGCSCSMPPPRSFSSSSCYFDPLPALSVPPVAAFSPCGWLLMFHAPSPPFQFLQLLLSSSISSHRCPTRAASIFSPCSFRSFGWLLVASFSMPSSSSLSPLSPSLQPLSLPAPLSLPVQRFCLQASCLRQAIRMPDLAPRVRLIYLHMLVMDVRYSCP